jgi:hypothetical protein
MQAAQTGGSATGTLFTWGLLALLVVAMVLFVGSAWLKSCKQAEGYTYMASMARAIDPQESKEVLQTTSVDIRAPPSQKTMAELEQLSQAIKNNTGPVAAEASGPKEMEKFRNLGGPIFEGFAGPVAGAGMPDCVRSSKEAAALYELMSGKVSVTEEVPMTCANSRSSWANSPASNGT